MVSRLKADMHIHTVYSDGKPTPEQVLLEASSKGLDVVSITDHDTFEGSLKALKIAREEGLEIIVVIGAEVRTSAGDILVYCPSEPLERIPRDPALLADHAHETGCIVVPAHPFDLRRKGIGSLLYELSDRWDAVEVFNAMSDPLANRRAYEASLQLGLPGVANSDAHVVEAVGAAYTLVDIKDYSAEEVIKAVSEGRVKPVAGRPGPTAYMKQFIWSVERRLRRRREKKGKGPSRLDYFEDYGGFEL